MNSPVLIEVPDRFETRRLVLRSPMPGDGAMVYRAVADSLVELRKFPASLPWAMHEPSIAASETYCREAHARFVLRTDLPFLILLRDTGEMVGSTGLHRFDWSVPRFEIGFWRRTPAHSQGYMTEAIRGLVGFAQTTLGARRLEAFTDNDNAASCALCERAGMILEGTLRHERRAPDGSLRDTRVYAIAR